MRMFVRVISSLLAAVCGAALGFGAVALVFAMFRQDAGIGGGLLALLAALIGAVVGAIATFLRLGTFAKSCGGAREQQPQQPAPATGATHRLSNP